MRLTENVVEKASSLHPVDVGVGVYSGDVFYRKPFANNHQRSVGKVHGQVGVLLGQLDDARQVLAGKVDQFHGAGGNPANKIDLSGDAEVEQMGYFGKYGDG